MIFFHRLSDPTVFAHRDVRFRARHTGLSLSSHRTWRNPVDLRALETLPGRESGGCRAQAFRLRRGKALPSCRILERAAIRIFVVDAQSQWAWTTLAKELAEPLDRGQAVAVHFIDGHPCVEELVAFASKQPGLPSGAAIVVHDDAVDGLRPASSRLAASGWKLGVFSESEMAHAFAYAIRQATYASEIRTEEVVPQLSPAQLGVGGRRGRRFESQAPELLAKARHPETSTIH